MTSASNNFENKITDILHRISFHVLWIVAIYIMLVISSAAPQQFSTLFC